MADPTPKPQKKTADEILQALADKGNGADKKAAAAEVATVLDADPTKKADVGKACADAAKILTAAKDALAAKKDPNDTDKQKLDQFNEAIKKIDDTNSLIGEPKKPAPEAAQVGGPKKKKDGPPPGAASSIYDALMKLLPSAAKHIDDLYDKIGDTKAYKKLEKAWDNLDITGSIKKGVGNLFKDKETDVKKPDAATNATPPVATTEAPVVDPEPTANATVAPLTTASNTEQLPTITTAANAAVTSAKAVDAERQTDATEAKNDDKRNPEPPTL